MSIANWLMSDSIAAIAYWADVRNVRTSAEGKYRVVSSMEVRDGAHEDGDPGEWVRVTAAAIRKAATALRDGRIQVRRDIAAQFIGSEWEYDSEGADCAVQAAVFGEIRFG